MAKKKTARKPEPKQKAPLWELAPTWFWITLPVGTLLFALGVTGFMLGWF